MATGATPVLRRPPRWRRGLVILPEMVKLTLLRTADGLALSWSAALTDWRLQSCATPEANWANVATPPVVANGQLTVTVPAPAGSQFYRLQGPTAHHPRGGRRCHAHWIGSRDPAPKSSSTPATHL
jgi:hypothetical protein